MANGRLRSRRNRKDQVIGAERPVSEDPNAAHTGRAAWRDRGPASGAIPIGLPAFGRHPDDRGGVRPVDVEPGANPVPPKEDVVDPPAIEKSIPLSPNGRIDSHVSYQVNVASAKENLYRPMTSMHSSARIISASRPWNSASNSAAHRANCSVSS